MMFAICFLEGPCMDRVQPFKSVATPSRLQSFTNPFTITDNRPTTQLHLLLTATLE
jgi:hypothetical protein